MSRGLGLTPPLATVIRLVVAEYGSSMKMDDTEQVSVQALTIVGATKPTV
jgi:hypothetical protein